MLDDWLEQAKMKYRDALAGLPGASHEEYVDEDIRREFACLLEEGKMMLDNFAHDFRYDLWERVKELRAPLRALRLSPYAATVEGVQARIANFLDELHSLYDLLRIAHLQYRYGSMRKD